MDVAIYQLKGEAKRLKEDLQQTNKKFNEEIQDCQFEVNNLKNLCSLVRVHEVNKVDKIDFMKLKSRVESDYTTLVKFREFTNSAQTEIGNNRELFDNFTAKYRGDLKRQTEENETHMRRLDENAMKIGDTSLEVEYNKTRIRDVNNEVKKVYNILPTKAKKKDFDALMARYEVFSKAETIEKMD